MTSSSAAAKSRTPILDSYSTAYVSAPEQSETRRFICPALKKIYINTAARPDASMDRIVPFSVKKETKAPTLALLPDGAVFVRLLTGEKNMLK